MPARATKYPVAEWILLDDGTGRTRALLLSCPFCHRQHVHGEGGGLRYAHCSGGTSYRLPDRPFLVASIESSAVFLDRMIGQLQHGLAELAGVPVEKMFRNPVPLSRVR